MNGTAYTPHSPVSLKYWDMLKGLSDNVKMELAAMLTTSLAEKNDFVETELTEEEKEREFWSLCGCWADDPEDAARMEAAIKEGRKNEYMLDVNLDD